MPAPLRVEAGEVTAAEILDALGEGRRVVAITEVLDDEHEVTLRHDGEQSTATRRRRCTPRLPDEMRQCIHEHGYASDG